MKARIACLAIALFSTLLSGCTVIGIVAGASADRRNARAHRVSWDGARSVPRGREVEVALTTGDTLNGTFKGLHTLPTGLYRYQYDSTRTWLGGDSLLPGFGETVSVVLASGPRVSGVFCGLEAEALVVYRKEDYSTAYVPLSNAAQLQGRNGQSYDLPSLRALASARVLPSDRAFELQTGEQIWRIPLERIQEVYAPPQPTHNWVLGGFIGLVIDVAVVVFVAPSIKFDLAPDINVSSSGSYYGGY